MASQKRATTTELTTSDEASSEISRDQQLQLALELFDRLAPDHGLISSADTPVGYNRADILLDIDKMSLLGRRALDTVYFIVANSVAHHKYITVTKEDGLKSYSIDKGFFLWLMSYSSRNWTHLQEALNQSHDAKVSVSIGEHSDTEQAFITKKGKTIANPESWVTVSLVIASGMNRDRVFFQVHPKLESFIRSPDRYHFLDLRFVFRSLYGRLLYEKISRYVDAGETPWFSLEEIRAAMKNDSPSLRNLRYLSQKVLAPAIEDINKNTDLHIERIEGRNPTDRRKLDRMKFTIRRKLAQPERADMAEMASGYDILVTEFGLNQTQIQTINKNRDEWDSTRISQAIEYTRYQLKRGRIKLSPAGYLMKALKEGYVLGTAMLELENQRNPAHGSTGAPSLDDPSNDGPSRTTPNQVSESDEDFVQKGKAGLRILKSLDRKTQVNLLAVFASSPAARVSASGDQVDLQSITCVEELISTPLLAKSFGWFVYQQHQKKKAED